MLTGTLAAELERAGILVNAAFPGYTRTDLSPDAQTPGPRRCRHAGLAGDPSRHRTDRGFLRMSGPRLVRSAWRPAAFGPARRQESGPGSKGLLAGEDLPPPRRLSD